MTFPLKSYKIWVAGHRGMVGSALLRRLAQENCQVITAERKDVDLTRQADVEAWLAEYKPDVALIAAGRVGGIIANDSSPADFLRDNLAIALNTIPASYQAGVRKLLFLGSSCAYPHNLSRPILEEDLLTGPFEPTNQGYALAKIAGITLCQTYRRQYGADFISAMPANLYGPGDNYHPEHAHVPASLIRRFHEAKLANSAEVMVWGSGSPRREFLHVDDLADACLFLLCNYRGSHALNIGTGCDISIADFALLVADVVGYSGRIRQDLTRPDGTPRKLMDISKITNLGWKARIGLREGLSRTYHDFLTGDGRYRDVV